MSNRIVKTVIQNGTKNLILHVYLESDGVEGELTNYVLIDPIVDYPEISSGNPNPNYPTYKDIKPIVSQIWYGFSWFDALLAFDDLTPAPSWNLARDAANYVDFRYFGGISDRIIDPATKASSDRTGKVLITTNGFAPLGSIGTMVIELRKNQN